MQSVVDTFKNQRMCSNRPRRPITATPHTHVALGSPLLNRNTRLLLALAETLKGFAHHAVIDKSFSLRYGVVQP